MTSVEYFSNNLKTHKLLSDSFAKKATSLAIARVIVFLVAMIVFVIMINQRELAIALLSSGIFLIIFVMLVRRFNKLRFWQDQHQHISEICEEESNRLKGNFDGLDEGVGFSDPKHQYTRDLDIFGKHSLYQMLNRTSTYPGKLKLANYLLGKEVPNGISQVNEGVSELAGSADLILEYQALGRHIHSEQKNYEDFENWLASPEYVKKKTYLNHLRWILPLLVFAGLVIATLFSLTYYILLPIIIANAYLLASFHKHANQVVDSTAASVELLKSYVRHIELLEEQSFLSPLLTALVADFRSDGGMAKKELGQLANYLEHLQSRKNLLHVFINIPLLLDIQWLWKIEEWMQQHRTNIARWFDNLAEIEVLISLAGQLFAQPTWTFPELSDQSYEISGKQIGHPLIHQDLRQDNDFKMSGRGKVILLTGPNMAGKSTFLRTIGINLVLAKMGAAVCAENFRFDPNIVLFMAMRVEDDLSESVSSFYAELARISQLFDQIDQKPVTLFFLDEILKGTNSADRHKGAEALIRQLIGLNVSGFVSTHDLELGRLSSELDGVQNFSFESTIDGGNINFDFKLRDGVSQSFNACELMRQMGIEV